MTSVVRTPSQIPASGTYVVTGSMTTAFDETGASFNIGDLSAGAILYDMGKTVFLPATGVVKTDVLRKVQLAPFEAIPNTASTTATSFYIRIGGTSGSASPVARL